MDNGRCNAEEAQTRLPLFVSPLKAFSQASYKGMKRGFFRIHIRTAERQGNRIKVRRSKPQNGERIKPTSGRTDEKKMKKTMILCLALLMGCQLLASLSDGLVAYYPFDGNANDESGYGNDGTTEGLRPVADRNGNENSALAFGGEDWIRVASSDSLNTVTNIYTMSFWMNASKWNNGAMHIIGKDYQFSCAFIKYDRAENGEPWYLGGGDVEDDFRLGFTVPLDSWHHWAITSDGHEIRIYVDGIIKTTFTGTGKVKVLSCPMYIGRTGDAMSPSGRSYFEGTLDEMRLYNRALSASEVVQLYGGQTTSANPKWTNENHWENENGVMEAQNFTNEGSVIRINHTGRLFLSVLGSGTLSFNARGSYDGFYYGGTGWNSVTYVRNSTDFKNYSITFTGNADEWHTIGWITYADGYLGTHAWGEIKDIAWNGLTVEYTSEEPEIQTWNIAFDANGGLIDGWETTRYVEVEDGAKFADSLGELPTPERMGYDFKGWFTDKDGGTQILDTTTAIADATYYAHWEENNEGCVVNGVRWLHQDCDELGGVEITGIGGNVPQNLIIPSQLTGKSVVAIGDYAFSPRYSLPEYNTITNVVLNAGLIRLSHGAFEACANLESVVVPSSITTVHGFVFADCHALVSVKIEEGVCALNECCFAGCDLLSDIELPSTITNLERAIFQECYSLTNVTFNGAKPYLSWYGEPFNDDDEFCDILWQVPIETTQFYVRKICGWEDENNNRLTTWFGRTIVYDPLPDIGDNATAEDIAGAFDGVQDRRLTAHITNKSGYNLFRHWLNRACASDFVKRQAVKDSAHAWLSFALDANALIVNPPKQGDLKIDTFKPSATSGAFDFDISVENIAIGEGATAANLAEIFGVEGAATPNGDYSSSTIELSFGTPVDGKVRCTARPKDSTVKSFFMKVKMTP